MMEYWGRLGGRLMIAVAVLCLSAGAAQAQMTPDAEFIRSIRKHDYGKVLPYLVNGGNPNGREYDSTPALVVAVEIGDPSLVKTLLEYKANPDLFNRSTGETALMRAATQKQLTSAQLLVYYNADLDAPDKQGETALIKAVRAKSEDIVALLVSAGADVTLADYTGMTPSDHARRIGNQRIVKIVETPPAAPATVSAPATPAIDLPPTVPDEKPAAAPRPPK
ncbi:ankyrin repeat domain-containing protein [Emcibacter sp. SYSU 3D8]|uniref:ankyrin repeat domain-containing protein n=1 Tax=Emcibacter sp. SYSU 3D8 TaxID=3133969 RepID=UPI0031FE6273